jgi:hypothetical protein
VVWHLQLRITWAAPLVQLPPARLAQQLMRRILSSNCTWWCRGRFWCERITLHPTAATVLRGLDCAEKLYAYHSVALQQCVDEYAGFLGLRVQRWDASGLWLRVQGRADSRVQPAVAKAVAASKGRPPQSFRPSVPSGAHALRVAARAWALNQATPARWDFEGMPCIDLEAQSAPQWRRFVKDLPEEERTVLRVVRGGAVHTPTRRWKQHEADLTCPTCGAQWASARHFWAECPQFRELRQTLARQYSVPAGWWHLQPRVTAKTAWITLRADAQPHRRVALQIAAARLAIAVAQWTSALPRRTPVHEA